MFSYYSTKMMNTFLVSVSFLMKYEHLVAAVYLSESISAHQKLLLIVLNTGTQICSEVNEDWFTLNIFVTRAEIECCER